MFVHVEPKLRGLSLMIPWAPGKDVAVSPLRELLFDLRLEEGRSFLSVESRTPSLHPECFSFFLTVADAIQLDGMEPESAITQELAAWEALLKPASRVSKEEEIGLVGELWVLHRLVGAYGQRAVTAWVAGDPESHDFRFEDIDLEVKTTTARERRHFINDPSQVTPLPGHALWVVSIQLAPAGLDNGQTLPEAVQALENTLSEPHTRTLFQTILEKRGYRGSDAAQYRTRLRLRTPPTLIPVDARFPAVTRLTLEAGLGKDLTTRIPEFRYVARLDGLGVADEDPQFLAILPGSSEAPLL